MQDSFEGYSAEIDLRLDVNGEILDVAQTGKDSLILREPRSLSGPAVILVTIAGQTERREVVLSSSSQEPSREVQFW
jgi:hypothetical protein